MYQKEVIELNMSDRNQPIRKCTSAYYTYYTILFFQLKNKNKNRIQDSKRLMITQESKIFNY